MSGEPRDGNGHPSEQPPASQVGQPVDGAARPAGNAGTPPGPEPLGRRGADTAPEGRRRRREEQSPDDPTVSVGELLAAMATPQPDRVDPAGPPAGSPTAADRERTSGANPPTPASSGPDPKTVLLRPDRGGGVDDQTMVLPLRIDSNDPAPVRDLDDPSTRTDLIPKLTGGTADRAEADSILAALRRQSSAVPAGAPAAVPASATAAALAGAHGVPSGGGAPPPPPPSSPGASASPAERPRRRHRGLLLAGRIIAAVLAFATLLGMGVEWNILDRAGKNIVSHSVDALSTADPQIYTARTTETVVTNSNGVKTTEQAKPPTVYAPENILLLGSDTRAGGNTAIGGSDSSTQDVSNSDTLMIAHVSGDRQRVTVLSIPRDTLIPSPKCKAWDANTGKVSTKDFPVTPGQISHINTAYAVGGPLCTVIAVQGLTHLGITRVIGIDFSGFQAMVDALGGINVNICRPIVDQVLGNVAPVAGPQKIAGLQAVSLVRARHVIGDTESDLARIRRQQGVLSAILRQVTAAGTLLNPNKLDNFLQAFTNNTFTTNIKLEDLVNLAGSLGSLDPGRVNFHTLPTVPSTRVDGALEVDKSKAPTFFDDLINDQPLPGDQTTPATTKANPTPGPTKTPASSLKLTVDPSKVTLEIYNVTGQGNVAGDTQTALNDIGFKVSDDQLFKPEGQVQKSTTVLYAPANRAAALTVAAAVPGSTLVITPGLGSTVRLLVGSAPTGAISRVKVGQTAPASLATAVSTGPSVSTDPAATSKSAAAAPLNAGTAGCI